MEITEITRNLKLNTIKPYTDISAQNRKYWPKNSRGQDITIEFIILVATVIILANEIGSSGWLTKKNDKSLHATRDKVTHEVKW